MGKLIYVTNMSVDGYIADAHGSFDWGQPSEELHEFFNELLRPIGTYLYGRAMYEVMSFWETAHTIPDRPAVEYELAEIWTAADKIVYSSTLATASTKRTRIESTFDAPHVRQLRDSSAKDITIGGARLAGQAFRDNLIDECHLLIHPVVLGAGQPALAPDVRQKLKLINHQCFAGDVVHLHYRIPA